MLEARSREEVPEAIREKERRPGAGETKIGGRKPRLKKIPRLPVTVLTG